MLEMAMRFTTKTVSKLLWVYPMSKTRRDKGDKMKNYQFMVMNHVIYAQKNNVNNYAICKKNI